LVDGGLDMEAFGGLGRPLFTDCCSGGRSNPAALTGGLIEASELLLSESHARVLNFIS